MKTLILLMLLAFATTGLAKEQLACATPTGDKVFVVNNGKISFIEGEQIQFSKKFREPSSFNEMEKTIDETMMFEGNKHIVHIENTKKLKETDDYLWVVNRKGHKFLYPLTCKRI